MRQVFIDSKSDFLHQIGGQKIFDWKSGNKGFFIESLTDDSFKIKIKMSWV